MYSLFSKYFITLNLILFSFLPLMVFDFIILWFLMEINNFLFISLLNYTMKNKKMIFFYFMIQIFPSFIIIFCSSINILFFINNHINLIMIIALLIKLSIPPFHFWLPIIATYLPWHMLFILLTLQKIPSFYLLSLINLNKFITFMILILCSLIPPYLMLNWNNLKTIMSYSSINQSSWMILLISFKNIIWFQYFIYYMMTLIPLFTLFQFFKIMKNYNNLPLNMNLITLLFMFNLAGLPPFSLFFLKWYSIFLSLLNNFNMLILIMMMMSSLIMLFIYTNIMINSMFLFKFKIKLLSFKYKPNLNLISIFFLSLLSSFLLLIL